MIKSYYKIATYSQINTIIQKIICESGAPRSVRLYNNLLDADFR